MKEKKTHSNILMNNILKSVYFLRMHSSEGKKENLTASICPPLLTSFNKNVFRRTRLSTRKNVGALQADGLAGLLFQAAVMKWKTAPK